MAPPRKHPIHRSLLKAVDTGPTDPLQATTALLAYVQGYLAGCEPELAESIGAARQVLQAKAFPPAEESNHE